VFQPNLLDAAESAALVESLGALHPLWEQRYGAFRPPPAGQENRGLLRPVYWLGNWQFACLGYYEPPRKIRDAAVRAEPFPPAIQRVADRAEALARRALPPAWIPRGWRLNTCLVNYYGSRVTDRGEDDAGRVGAHQDYEPGPVASFSVGERALFQFVPRGGGAPVKTLWLEEGTLKVFGGPTWKDGLLHRVTRVEDKRGLDLPPRVPGFRTRRINLTFRYVPEAHIVDYAALRPAARADVAGYVRELAEHSPFWDSVARSAPP
jgi:alkylated DNA repair dioxygenase AlkB